MSAMKGRLDSTPDGFEISVLIKQSLALCRRVSLDLQAQVAAAVSAERFSEADALQGELDAAAADAAALKAGHDFTDKDLGSSLQSLSHLSTVEDGAAAQQAEALSCLHP